MKNLGVLSVVVQCAADHVVTVHAEGLNKEFPKQIIHEIYS